jgi:hypothetical protein
MKNIKLLDCFNDSSWNGKTKIEKSGWIELKTGNPTLSERLFFKQQRLSGSIVKQHQKFPNFDQKVGLEVPSPTLTKNEMAKFQALKGGVKFNTGSPVVTLTPHEAKITSSEESLKKFIYKNRMGRELDVLKLPDNSFNEIRSLSCLQGETRTMSVGFDCEWYGENPRRPLSYQFSWVIDDVLNELVILNTRENDEHKLSLSVALGLVLSISQVKSYRYSDYVGFRGCVGFDSATGKPIYEFFKDKKELVANSHRIYPLFKSTHPEKLVERNGSICVEKCNEYTIYTPGSKTINQYHNEGTIEVPQDEIDSFQGKDPKKLYFNKYQKSGEHRDDWVWGTREAKFPKEAYSSIQLVCHTGKVDLSLFSCEDFDGYGNILRYCNDIQGGCISMLPTKRTLYDSFKSGNNRYVFPIRLTIRDTMGQAPAGSKSLDTLGKLIGIKKLDDSRIDKANMNQFFHDYPALFLEYAARDSTVTLLYFSSIYGINRKGAVTLTSASAKIIKDKIAEYLDCKPSDPKDPNGEFNLIFRGLKKKKDDVYFDEELGYLQCSKLYPISREVSEIQQFCTLAYHGGYNGSSKIGWYTGLTFDHDLKGAYPTAMTVVPDINWKNPIKQEISDKDIDLNLFLTMYGTYQPLIPFVGYFTFEFPENVKYPCFCYQSMGNLVFPLSSRDSGDSDFKEGVYATGVEVYLALQLGAKVHCERGFILNVLPNKEGNTCSLGYAIKSIINDRELSQKLFGKKSFADQLLKLMVNSGSYGKTVQNVVPKKSYSTYSKEMEPMGESILTNPFVAAFTTAIVRCELIATMNQLHEMGYDVYSYTTDGFITNAPVDVMEKCDMYGIKPFMENARLFLTDEKSSKVWEVKHTQERLLNLTTRGNMGAEAGGVSAHNSTKSPYEKDDPDYEEKDREWFIVCALSRDGKVSYHCPVWTTFKDIAQGQEFIVKDTIKSVGMDFDMKRKPDFSTMEDIEVVYKGENYITANFDTKPFETVAEFVKYKNKKKQFNCLRTVDQWTMFRLKTEEENCLYVRDLDWTIVFSCVQGHRLGMWNIPTLDSKSLNVQEKCDWINSLNLCDREFKKSDWKNARRPERAKSILPEYMIEKTLDIMQGKAKQVVNG